MDWQNLRFDWNHARAFLVTAEEGSLSAAARALGMTQPTLGRQVAALEEELGIALFERVGRGLELTPAGMELLDHVRAMANAADHVARTATGQSQTISGSIRITASEIYSAYLLPPVIRMLRELAPALQIELVASNDLRDLQRREADVALRNARPTDGDLIAKQVAEDTGYFYASDALARQLGPLSDAAALAKAPFVGMAQNERLVAGLQAMGLAVTDENFVVQSDSHLVHWELARKGLGIGVVPTWLGDATPGMRRIKCDVGPVVYPVWLVAHREVQTSAKVRLVYDLMAREVPRLLRG